MGFFTVFPEQPGRRVIDLTALYNSESLGESLVLNQVGLAKKGLTWSRSHEHISLQKLTLHLSPLLIIPSE